DREISQAYLDDDRVERSRSIAERLAEAKETAEENGPMRGRSDPRDPKYKAYHRKQSAAPFVECDPDDDDGVCPLCGRGGDDDGYSPYLGSRGYLSRGSDDGDEEEAKRIVRRQTQTHTESAQRLDQMRRDHAARMAKLYQQRDSADSLAYRKG